MPLISISNGGLGHGGGGERYVYLLVFLWWLKAIFLSFIVSSKVDASDLRSTMEDYVISGGLGEVGLLTYLYSFGD